MKSTFKKFITTALSIVFCILLILQIQPVSTHASTEPETPQQESESLPTDSVSSATEQPSPIVSDEAPSHTVLAEEPEESPIPTDLEPNNTEEDSSLSQETASEPSDPSVEGFSLESQITAFSVANLNFSQIYDGTNFKSFNQLITDGLLDAGVTQLNLVYDWEDPTIYTGIPGLPGSVVVNISVPGGLTSNHSYLAIGSGIVVNDITVGTPGISQTIGSVVVIGEANSIHVLENTAFDADHAIISENGVYSWIGPIPASARSITSEITGVLLGAFDGGKIKGTITLDDFVNISAYEVGFMGSVVGAYRNASVGSIILGDYVTIYAGYVQNVIGANEDSRAGNITIGTGFNLSYSNAQFAVVGAASGMPVDQRKPSHVGIISMRANTQFFEMYGGGEDPDVYSNVAIGAERGSSVDQIRMEETLEWVTNPDHSYETLYIVSSSHVAIGAYDGATVGTSDSSDAIILRYVSMWNSSYYSGNILLGAYLNSTIKGNIVFDVSGFNTSFGEAPTYIAVVGTASNSHVTGTLLMRAFAYGASWSNPKTLIGPGDATSSIHQVKIELFASLRSWEYTPLSYNMIGSPSGRIDKLWIDGDLYLQMPRNTYGAFGISNADFYANDILITNGNIIGQDLSIKYDYDPGSAADQYRNDPDRIYKVPPWIHSNIKMSTAPKNQYGEIVSAYTILDSRVDDVLAMFNPPATKPVNVSSQSGSDYIYRYGNDVRGYLAYMGLIDPEDPNAGQGALHPSWLPDIYPIWIYDGMVVDDPFVHFVYLPNVTIQPLSYRPTNIGGNISLADQKTSVKLNVPISLSYLIGNGHAPIIKITDTSTGQPLISFPMNLANFNKYFYISPDGALSADSGRFIVINLDQIPGINKDIAYQVEIAPNSLFAQFATTSILTVQNATAQNPGIVGWKFYFPSPPIPTPTPTPIPTPTPVPTPTPIPTPTPTTEPTLAPTAAPTGTARPTPTRTAKPEPTLTIEPSASPSPSASLSPSPSPIISPSPSQGNGGNSSNGSGGTLTPEEEREDTLQELINEGVPILQIGNTQVPLHGGSSRNVWSLFNLIIALIGIGFAAVIIIVSAIRYIRSTGPDSTITQTPLTPEAKRKQLLKWLGVAAGVILPILFLITQNMDHLMVIFDRWSWLVGVIAACEAVLLILSKNKTSEDIGTDN